MFHRSGAGRTVQADLGWNSHPYVLYYRPVVPVWDGLPSPSLEVDTAGRGYTLYRVSLLLVVSKGMWEMVVYIVNNLILYEISIYIAGQDVIIS